MASNPKPTTRSSQLTRAVAVTAKHAAVDSREAIGMTVVTALRTDELQPVLVTGGAGFIGANFVLDCVRVKISRSLRSTSSPTPATFTISPVYRATKGIHSFMAISAIRILSARFSPESNHAPLSISRPSHMSTVRYSARKILLQPTLSAPSDCSKPRATIGLDCRRGTKKPSAFSTSRPTRSMAR